MAPPSIGIDIDIERNLAGFTDYGDPWARDASFDFCFNYFQGYRESGRLSELASEGQVQTSCLQLGFYLASWGMYRGSTKLLKKSAYALAPTIEALADAPAEVWAADADSYTEETIEAIRSFIATLGYAIPGGNSYTLTTKVLLGTMGCVPAFDTRFSKAFHSGTPHKKSLRRIADFYDDHSDIIDANRRPTLDFDTGKETKRLYTRAKVIDMIFFVEGGR